MIPLRDKAPNVFVDFSFMTFVLIIINTGVLIYTVQLYGAEGQTAVEEFYYRFGLIPADVWAGHSGGLFTTFTSMFIHGGAIHLMSNMLALWVFGRRVEDACGPWRFLIFYLLCGLGADLIYVLVRHQSDIPTVGASGALFGVMAAYMLIYPGGQIRTIVLNLSVIDVDAIWIILYFAIAQIAPALQVIAGEADYSVAYWAHLGGFACGGLVVLFMRQELFALFRFKWIGR